MMKTENKVQNSRNICLLAMIFILLFYVACAPSWSPPDHKAADLVREHYLFFDSGKAIIATVEDRGEYISECKCFPVLFNIVFENNKNLKKTFYFYKDASGNVAAKEFNRIE